MAVTMQTPAGTEGSATGRVMVEGSMGKMYARGSDGGKCMWFANGWDDDKPVGLRRSTPSLGPHSEMQLGRRLFLVPGPPTTRPSTIREDMFESIASKYTYWCFRVDGGWEIRFPDSSEDLPHDMYCLLVGYDNRD